MISARVMVCTDLLSGGYEMRLEMIQGGHPRVSRPTKTQNKNTVLKVDIGSRTISLLHPWLRS